MGIGIGVIGAGIMGADHARIIAAEVARARVVAIADPDRGRAEAAAAASRGARIAADAQALIDDPAVDAVVIASPDAAHAGHTLACIAAGKPVLCEKPLAPTLPEARAVLAAEAAGGRRLVQVGYMRRFDPGYGAMREGLAGGGLGAALMLHCVHRNAAAPAWFTPAMAVTNSLVHEIDAARWLLGREVAAIRVLGGRAGGPLLAILEMAGGALVDVEVFVNAGYGYEVRAELVCQAGTLTLARPAATEQRADGRQSAAVAADWRPRFAAAYRRQLQAFVDAVEAGTTAGASAWDGLAATAVADAGVRALASGDGIAVELPPRPAFYGGAD